MNKREEINNEMASLSKRDCAQVCHLMQALSARRQRAFIAAAWHWLAFVAINPFNAIRFAMMRRGVK